MLVFWLTACDEAVDTVTLSGIVEDAPGDAGAVVAGAEVTAQNRAGEVTGTDTTGDDGAFDVVLGAGVSFFLTISGEGYVDTSFSGYAGTADFDSEPGYPWLATPDWVATEAALFAGCATADAEGTLVVGQTLVYIEGSGDPGSWPAIADATVEVLGSDGGTYPACYLDDSGASAPEAAGTGGTGEFAVFGVPAGGINVKVTAQRSNGELGTDVFEFIAPDHGLVPIFPTGLAL